MTITTDPDPAPGASAVAAPAPAEGLELLGAVAGSGYRTSPSLVRRRDGQTVQLTPLLYLVLEAADGRRTCDEIAELVSERLGRRLDAEGVRQLVAKLQPLGLLRGRDGSEPELRRTNPLLALRCRYVVTDPAVTQRITAPFAWLFRPLVVAAIVVVFVAVCVWTLGTKGLASATFHAFDRPGLLLAVFLITVLSAGFHEFGHAAAARYGGATPGAMGAGLYLLWPAFYTDVTDSYRLGRGGRLRTDLGGLYFNAIVAVAVFALWSVVGWDALLLIIATQILQMVRQLTPVVRCDGYHVLADLTGVPDLYHHIGPTLRGLLPWRRRRGDATGFKPWTRAVVTMWVLLTVPLLAAAFVLMVLAMPRLAATAASNLADRWTTLSRDVGAGDMVRAVVNVLGMGAIALPLAGGIYLLARVVRRTVSRVRRATAQRPRRQATAFVAVAALIAALAWAWWPGNGDYRPVQAHERGTIGDAVAAVTGSRDDGADDVDGMGGVDEGPTARGQALWPADDDHRPTQDEPTLALVLVPVDESATAPTWVFPFNRPLPPGPGDNQALAINTTDGTVVYDVAFALVWVESGDVLNRNEAIALASCTDCAAVAVGFQVVLTIGRVDVAVPQNTAVAVNYACLRCLTYAIASQLVITLPGELSAGAQAELASLWDEIRRFGAQIADVPLAELQARLRDYERQIVEIVRTEADRTGVTPQPEAVDEPGTSTAPDPEDDGATAPTTLEPDGDPTPTTTPTPPSIADQAPTEQPDAEEPTSSITTGGG